MGHTSYVTALHLSNLELFSASADGSIRVTDIRTGNGRTVLETGLSCFSVYHRVEGPTRWVASGHSDGTVRLTNVLTGNVVQEYPSASEGESNRLERDSVPHFFPDEMPAKQAKSSRLWRILQASCSLGEVPRRTRARGREEERAPHRSACACEPAVAIVCCHSDKGTWGGEAPGECA